LTSTSVVGRDCQGLAVIGPRLAVVDERLAGGGWAAAGQETLEGAVFNVYIQGDAVLKVDCDIDQSFIGLA
jgi:hypothetical protein